jgi:hypothetical protein
MHSDWFNEIEILRGGWQHGEKVGYCYHSGLEKTLCKAGHEGVKERVKLYLYSPSGSWPIVG